MKIIIVDYGMGNVYSLQSALKFLEFDSICTSNHEEITNADKIILPGVGSFKEAIDNIKRLNLIPVLKTAVIENKTPILGICLGMQLLGSSSTEDKFSKGLGFFPGIVEKFNNNSLKIPHVGFNNVLPANNSKLYSDFNKNLDFYFVHSYRMLTEVKNGVAYCNYGEDFVASFEYQNIFGTQFHPEKSQTNGLKLIKNFLKL